MFRRIVLIYGVILFLLSTCFLISSVEARKITYKVTAYAYNACRKQTDKNPHETAFGKKPKKGITIAVSNDLKHLKNKNVRLVNVKTKKTIGVYKVGDVMANRHRRSVDIFMGKDKKLARKFGKQKAKLEVLCLR